MKNVIARLMVAPIMVAGCALAPIGLYAQSRSVVADVPFAFYMGEKAMPQGSYRVSGIMDGAIITVHSAAASNSLATVSVAGTKEYEPPRLVFTCYGETCFLNQIWTGYSSHGLAMLHSKREKQMASTGRKATLAVIKLAVH